ncbi:MAG: hypothetical protein OEU26_02310 [Candidatus Tectomicrobia bacterium]|nr:hypothetical protein [Candidatus Tectomicrobia bacterium]
MASRHLCRILLPICWGLLASGLLGGFSDGSWGQEAPPWQRNPKPRAEGAQPSAKVSATLRAVLAQIDTYGVASAANPLVRIDRHGRLHCYIHVEAWGPRETEQLREYAVIVERHQADLGIVQAWIPFDRVMQVAQLDFVKRITPPSYASLRPQAGRPDVGKTVGRTDKISPSLRTVLQALKANVVISQRRPARQPETFSTSRVKVSPRGAIHARLHVKAFNASHLAALESKGFQLEIANAVLNLIQGWVPFDRVEEVVALDVVNWIEPPTDGGLTPSAKP